MHVKTLFRGLRSRLKESRHIQTYHGYDDNDVSAVAANRPISKAKPLFLVAPPRSGTTILTHILNSHPEIILTNESAVFLQLADAIEKSRIGSKAGRNYGKAYHALWADHLESTSKGLIERYYNRIAILEEKTNVRYWGEKHPHLHVCLEFVRKIYPDATYIYLVRDPRDVALSLAKMRGDSFENQLLNWKRFSYHYENIATGVSNQNAIVVKYEDLLKDYANTVDEILSRLGVEESDKVTDYIEENKNIQAHGVLGRKRFDGQSAKYRWRTLLDKEQKLYAIEEAGSFLTKYGYPL